MSLKEVAEFHGVSRFRAGCRFLLNFILGMLADACPVPRIRPALHRLRGVNIGEGVYIGRDVVIDSVYPDQVHIGDDTSIGEGSAIYAHNNIPSNTLLREIFPTTVSPVRIGRGVWIMPRVIVIPGISIGDECVIGVGSTVTRDIPPRSLAAGVPARVIRDLGEHQVFRKAGKSSRTTRGA